MTTQQFLQERLRTAIRSQRYSALEWRRWNGRLKVAEFHLYDAIGANLNVRRLRAKIAALNKRQALPGAKVR